MNARRASAGFKILVHGLNLLIALYWCVVAIADSGQSQSGSMNPEYLAGLGLAAIWTAGAIGLLFKWRLAWAVSLGCASVFLALVAFLALKGILTLFKGEDSSEGIVLLFIAGIGLVLCLPLELGLLFGRSELLQKHPTPETAP